MTLIIKTLDDPLSADFASLAVAAEGEGFAHMRRVIDEWTEGTNRFDKAGEKLLCVYDEGLLVAVGGINHEFSRADWLRMRRFYVLPQHRGKGVARLLATQLIEHARNHTTTITVHAGVHASDERAGLFWQAMGFRPLVREQYTHILEFA